MKDSLTMEEVLTKYPERLVVLMVAERDKGNFARKFLVLHSSFSITETRRVFADYKAQGLDVLLMPTYKNKIATVVRANKNKITFEDVLTPAESAEMFRTYYGIPASI